MPALTARSWLSLPCPMAACDSNPLEHRKCLPWTVASGLSLQIYLHSEKMENLCRFKSLWKANFSLSLLWASRRGFLSPAPSLLLSPRPAAGSVPSPHISLSQKTQAGFCLSGWSENSQGRLLLEKTQSLVLQWPPRPPEMFPRQL